MILKMRMTDLSRKNIAIIKARQFSETDRITAGYIIGEAVEKTAQLSEEAWKTAVSDMLREKEPSAAKSTSVSLRQSVYERLCELQERIRKLCGKEIHMSQVIDLVLSAAAGRSGADRIAAPLKVMEWNINARTARPGYSVPVNLIANEVLKKEPDIFVLTEFVQAGGWLDLKAILSSEYELSVSPYQPHRNGICIGIRKGSGIACVGGRARTFCDGPDFHELVVRINGKPVSVIGTRIRIDWKKKHSKRFDEQLLEQKERFQQFLRLVEYIAPLEEDVLVLGDFNNSRILGPEDEADEGKFQEAYQAKKAVLSLAYNYQKMRAALTARTAGKLSLRTAEGCASSVGAFWDESIHQACPPRPNREQKHKYDHIITRSDLCVRAAEYDWDFLNFYGPEHFEAGKGSKIRAGFPDHAILWAEIAPGQQGAPEAGVPDLKK